MPWKRRYFDSESFTKDPESDILSFFLGTASMKHDNITIENYNATKDEDIVSYCTDQKVDLVIVGPEVPLANGLAGEY